MAIQYAIIDDSGHLLIGWDWQFDADTFGVGITCSYSVWMVPNTGDPTED